MMHLIQAKTIIKWFYPIAFILLFTVYAYSQERINIQKKEFKQAGDSFNVAWKQVRKGNFLYYQHRNGSYRKAIPHYKEALKLNPENPELNLLLGICYLRSWPKENALPFIRKASDLKPEIHPNIQLLLGRAFHNSGDYNNATMAYNTFKESLDLKKDGLTIDLVNRYIGQCETGLLLKKKPGRALIDNIGPNINSSFDDYNPGFSADGQILAFTSRRRGISKHISPIDHLYFEDIYFCRKEGKEWSAAENADKPLNSKWNDALVSLSNDGQKMIVYKGHKKKGDLFASTKKVDGWGYFQRLTGKINNRNSQESSVCFNVDGTKMYFISDMIEGSNGGKDIYYCMLDENKKKWSKPINMGSEINSKYDEVSVFISEDESSLYFSSNRPQSIGGFDIFKTTFKNDEWTEPVNLGIPINTPNDDIFFRLMPNKRDAFYSSDNQSGKGGFDIYSVILLGPEKPYSLAGEQEPLAGLINPEFDPILEDAVQLSYTRMTVVKGIVSDYNTGQPVLATVELVDNATGKKERESKSDKSTGAYMIALPSGKNYGFSVNADGYMFHSENFNVPAASGFKEIFKDIQLQPMTAGSKIILYNTFFASGKANLKPESYSELNRLALMFTKYPNLVIEISGHTDNRGSLATNKKLSMSRAKSVVDYLVGQGVPSANLKAVGYYYLQPVANNKTEAGRQQNRRVEAKIISN